MGLHVFKALVEIGEHLGKLLCSHQIGRTGGIESAGHGFQIGIVLEVVVHFVSKRGDATLFGHQ